MLLNHEQFITVVQYSPLVSIDLVVQNSLGQVLLGFRSNRPAQNCWFVPGGRVCKDERLAQAFRRITRGELGVELEIDSARFLGVYEHLYPDNFLEREGISTHYIVLAHRLELDIDLAALPPDQHRDFRWFSVPELLASDLVHANTQAYFRPEAG